jgi:hypothetical protein
MIIFECRGVAHTVASGWRLRHLLSAIRGGFLILQVRCSSPDNTFPPMDEDFCPPIHFDRPQPLSRQLLSFADSMAAGNCSEGYFVSMLMIVKNLFTQTLRMTLYAIPRSI